MEKSVGAKNKVIRFLKALGPGLITGASDDDPSGIATYSQAGAQFGLATLWTALVTFPLMAAIQGMCARIGLVTSVGLTSTLNKYYPKPVLYLMMLFSIPAIILNIGSDIAAMGAVANLMIPSVHPIFFSVFFSVILMIAIVNLAYKKIVAVLKYLCISLFLYILVPFFTKPHWHDIIKSTLIPTFHTNKEFMTMLVAILGTTISPYLFFWQASMEAEDINHVNKRLIVNNRVVKEETVLQQGETREKKFYRLLIIKMTTDVNFGMLLSNMVMFFIILATGTALFNAGVRHIDTVEQAAKALEPVAGKLSYILFTVGVIGTGFLAIPVLSGSLSYIISETFNWKGSLDKKFYQAKPFYLVIIVSIILGVLINYVGISPIQALIYTAVLYGITSPVIIAIVLHIGNNKKIMGDFTNRKLSNILGFATLLLMTVSAVYLIYLQFN